MSIQKKSLFKVIASTALVGFFASCAEIAPPDGAGDEFSEGSCQEIWGINSKCDEVQKEDDQNQEPESSASEDAGDETSSDSENGDEESSEGEDSSPDSEGDSSDSEGGTSEEGGNEDDSGSEEGDESDDPKNNPSKDEVVVGDESYQFTDGCTGGQTCASIGKDGMEELTPEEKIELNNKIGDMEEKDPNFNLGDMDFDKFDYFCFTGDNDWLRIPYASMSSSNLAFLRNGHAWGQRKKYDIRFEDACDAVYVMQKNK